MKTTLCLYAIALLQLFGCRTGQRPNVTSENPIKIEIRMNGLDPNTLNQYKLVAQLKLCADTSGTLASGTTFGFSAFGLKKDVVCQVRIVGPKAADAGVVFFGGGEDGLYFSDSEVTIREDQNGALTAEAYLQKLFTNSISPQTTTWKMETVIQSEAVLSANCTCRIQCSPNILNDASIVKPINANEGKCTFDNAVISDLTSTTCSEMVVQCSDKIYAGKWNPSVRVDSTSGKSQTLPTLKITSATPTPEGDVVISPEIKKK